MLGQAYRKTKNFKELVMTALRKYVEVPEYAEAEEAWTPVVIVKKAAAPATAPAAETAKAGMLKNMALFLMAPFIGLLYAVLLPFVGLGMLAWIGGKALVARPRAREALRFGVFMLKVMAAPWIALAYLVALPFVGVAMVAGIGGKALVAAAVAK
jgi:hypothetical protein